MHAAGRPPRQAACVQHLCGCPGMAVSLRPQQGQGGCVPVIILDGGPLGVQASLSSGL